MRSKPYDVLWPLSPHGLENVNENFDYLFHAVEGLRLTYPLGVMQGGTGQTGFSPGDVIVAQDSDLLVGLPDVAVGNVLLSGGVGNQPSYGKVALSGAPTHITGVLPVPNGGTGLSTVTTGDLLYASGADTIAALAAGTAGYVLRMGASVPEWASAAVAAAHAILSATHTDSTPAAVVRGDLITGQGATPAWARLAKGSLGYLLTMNADEPEWAAPTVPSGPSGPGTIPTAVYATGADVWADGAVVGPVGGIPATEGCTYWFDGAIVPPATDASLIWGSSGSPTVAGQVWRYDGVATGWSHVRADELYDGTLDDGRLSANVALLDRLNAFTERNTFSYGVDYTVYIESTGALATDVALWARSFGLQPYCAIFEMQDALSNGNNYSNSFRHSLTGGAGGQAGMGTGAHFELPDDAGTIRKAASIRANWINPATAGYYASFTIASRNNSALTTAMVFEGGVANTSYANLLPSVNTLTLGNSTTGWNSVYFDAGGRLYQSGNYFLYRWDTAAAAAGFFIHDNRNTAGSAEFMVTEDGGAAEYARFVRYGSTHASYPRQLWITASGAGASVYISQPVGIGALAGVERQLYVYRSGAKTAHDYGAVIYSAATSSTAAITKAALRLDSVGVWDGAGSFNIGLFILTVSGGIANYAIYDVSGAPWYTTSDVRVARLGVGTGLLGDCVSYFYRTGAKTAHDFAIRVWSDATSGTAAITKAALNLTSTGVWNGVGAINAALFIGTVSGGTQNFGIYDSSGQIAYFSGADIQLGADVHITRVGANILGTPDAMQVTGGFGCNGTTPQTAYASGGALGAYADGTHGLYAAAEMEALYDLVVAIRAALVANGIMS